ncbi:DUF3857 domain-containing protein [Paucihalobacter ruber]|uniref:DUF3857 domain-containing protein n=1 Tax=Paucihalobacter ruber TaxID=2567861 RepID=A0A506PHX5_9FLAO|nr:DUF3857 domain-containing protein [Paucihalobacter ruber]TPV31970.1 DUF3857 domain-containing protein [Paucihalobacter ruber]
MTFKTLPYYLLFFICLLSYSQTQDLYNASLIPDELSDKVNSVVRYHDTKIDISAYNRMLVTEKRIITVYNKIGDRNLRAFAGYDDKRTIKKIEAFVYDKSGNQIKKFKKGDFVDESAVSGGTLYSDSRVKYLNYTPISYPYTLEFYAEIDYQTTAFIPTWQPLEKYYNATQNSEYQIINNSGVELKSKASNFEGFNIETKGPLHYKASNMPAIAYEEYSPDFDSFTPEFKAALIEFDMEGVKGINNNWQEFGKWMNDVLIADTQKLPESVINEVKALTAYTNDPIEKAKIVYQFVQDKTRYISVQVGIGGWKPISAMEVNQVGYGDCKGLTNYTQALLKEIGVESYYTVIYGGSGRIYDIDKDFSSTQGNHVILCLPNEDDYIWLECTSQTNPFGLIAGFTDDRAALIIKPEGGEVVRTKAYKPYESLQHTKATVLFDESGNLEASVEIKSTGYQYSLREAYETKDVKEQNLNYKNYWGNINNLQIDGVSFKNDKDEIEFVENVNLSAKNYASKTGNRLLLQPNLFNVVSTIPARYSTRYLDFQISRGYEDQDEYVLEFPDTLEIEALPEPVLIDTKFGTYEFSIETLDKNKVQYKRKYILNKGSYAKEEYEDFREFRKLIAKHDKAKMVLKTK